MGGFFHTKIPGSAEIVTPVKAKNPIGVFSGYCKGFICGAGICKHDLETIGDKPLQAFLDMRLFIFGNDTYG